VRDVEDFLEVRKERVLFDELYSLPRIQDVARREGRKKETSNERTVEINKGRCAISAGGVGGVMPRVPPRQRAVEGRSPVTK